MNPDTILISENLAFVESVSNVLEQCYMYSAHSMKSKESVYNILNSF